MIGAAAVRVGIVAVFWLAAPSVVADPPPGAMACFGCHPRSAATAGGFAAITGRPAADTLSLMRGFRAGVGAPTVMDRIARGFTDVELEALAQWLERRR
jgi:cytochrome c553